MTCPYYVMDDTRMKMIIYEYNFNMKYEYENGSNENKSRRIISEEMIQQYTLRANEVGDGAAEGGREYVENLVEGED